MQVLVKHDYKAIFVESTALQIDYQRKSHLIWKKYFWELWYYLYAIYKSIQVIEIGSIGTIGMNLKTMKFIRFAASSSLISTIKIINVSALGCKSQDFWLGKRKTPN